MTIDAGLDDGRRILEAERRNPTTSRPTFEPEQKPENQKKIIGHQKC